MLKEIVASDAAKKSSGQPLSVLMRMAMDEVGVISSWADVSRTGWKLSSAHHYWRRHPRESVVVSGGIARGARRARHLKHLADEVVVISLPERKDRRKQIRKMMEREGVAFRFADGVRVAYENIQPEEVAEVGWAGFKAVAGLEKYLCGMVACRRAHLRCLEEAYRTGLKSLLLIEDDMRFVDQWVERYMAAVSELPKDWQQLYLSAADFLRSEPFSANLHRLTGSYQTTAILYSEAGIEAAVKALRRSRCEIDAWMGCHLHPFGGCYAIRPGVTFQQGGVSDIMSFDRGVTA